MAGSYKLNIDASYHEDGFGAAGVVLRDHRGEAVAGLLSPLDNLLSAATTEARGLLEGLEFLEEKGCSNVTIESDSLKLIIECCNGTIEV